MLKFLFKIIILIIVYVFERANCPAQGHTGRVYVWTDILIQILIKNAPPKYNAGKMKAWAMAVEEDPQGSIDAVCMDTLLQSII